MGIYDGFKDAPHQIKQEGQQIDIAFIRNGDGTATIKWTIPSPVAGCSAEDQAYDGIVIVVSDKPANYITTSPKDTKYYIGDPTFNTDLHSGDKISDALVVGAFYHDKTTRSLIVHDVLDKTPYYVSGYAVDSVGRYHREGVHAYSLPTGNDEYNDTGDTAARQDIGLDLVPILPSTSTGLVSGTEYSFKIVINAVEYTITVDGADALTYGQLIAAINEEFIRITDAESVDLTETHFYFDEATEILYKWEFDKYVEVDVIIDDEDPTIPVNGKYWYDNENLYVYESSGWMQVPLINVSYDPINPSCNGIWFDGSIVRMWENTHWCELPTYIQNTNPLLPPTMTCDNYWYDSVENLLKVWSIDINGWEAVDPIYTAYDPNTIGIGEYWYNNSDDIMKVRLSGSVWGDLNNIVYSERNSSNDLDNPQSNQYWYIPSEQLFYRRNDANTSWVELDFILSANDPTIRNSCDIWWNSSPSIDELYVWDSVNYVWILTTTFVQGEVDPSLPPELSENSAWYSPETNTIKLLTMVDCEFNSVEFIDLPTDPKDIEYGVGWFDGEDFFISDGIGGWANIDPIVSDDDPYIVDIGDYWYDNENLYEWDGSVWIPISLADDLTYPTEGDIVLNTDDSKLYLWNGITWVVTDAIAKVILINPNSPNLTNSLCFITTALGCNESIYIIVEAGNLFTQLSTTVVYYDPVEGTSRLELGPTYTALGIGDDGSPDERRNLHRIIRQRLGDPSQLVELTDDQIDEAINSALAMIRKYSGYGYERFYFFLDLKPNQQKYILTNRCVGFNKIVSINNIHRMRSGFLTGFGTSYDLFGYQAFVNLYRAGSFDMLSYHLVSSYIEDLQILFADQITFNWMEKRRELKLYHTIYRKERVLLDAYVERSEQDILTDRETREWVKKWAVAESKMMLSQIRGKFQTLPGPQGSTTLNSQELITQAETELAELKLELEDAAMQNYEQVNMAGQFIIG